MDAGIANIARAAGDAVNAPFIQYQDRYIWITRDEAGFYYEITNMVWKTLHTSTDSFSERGYAELAARRWIETHSSPEWAEYNREICP